MLHIFQWNSDLSVLYDTLDGLQPPKPWVQDKQWWMDGHFKLYNRETSSFFHFSVWWCWVFIIFRHKAQWLDWKCNMHGRSRPWRHHIPGCSALPVHTEEAALSKGFTLEPVLRRFCGFSCAIKSVVFPYENLHRENGSLQCAQSYLNMLKDKKHKKYVNIFFIS